MKIVGFNEWTLNEANEYYVIFTVPNNNGIENNKLDDIFKQEVIKFFDEAPGINYSIEERAGLQKEGLIVNISPEKDELFQAVYGVMIKSGEIGVSDSTQINFLRYPSYSSDLGRVYPYDIITAFKKIPRRIIKDKGTESEIKIAIYDESKIDEIINKVTEEVVYTLRTPRNRYTRLQPEDIFHSVLGSNQTELESVTANLTMMFREDAVKLFLKSCITNQYSPDLEKIKSESSEKLDRFNKMSDSQKKESLEEILKFNKELLSMADENTHESTEITKYLIGTFRILLAQLGSIGEIKRRLDSI
jgi:hypothetical protein